ncbi:hypothetical protein [Modestobacter sp. VKM Ac-2985]|uniref:hypothetical protein n=1 Tax=Modestobacter sp. VKM Ac-2985 TaxID=3004139 RepID=UPI0022AB5C4F|nr:hypothetical protein [Modestobacter sp. VKM Ac-2985]MCZ2836653.1 hypothetical protein [Modestobacter sp. VKM Ac-2985]
MRLRSIGRTERTTTTTTSPPRRRASFRMRLRRRWRAGVLVRTAWCAYCEVRPRTGLAGDAGRFCSSECAGREADDNWSIA